jgi:hypothetical protein
LIDFAGQKIFDSATVDTNILIFSKEANNENTLSCCVKEEMLNNLGIFVREHGTNTNFNCSESWVILSDIEKLIKKKIERLGTPLKDWDIQINYGIKTGFNDAFIINGEKRKELIEKDPKSDEIIRPILRGRDIKRYSYEFANLFLIATFPSKKYKIEDFPAIKQHLLSFDYDRIKQTGEPGARKKTNNKWFETQDSINYWEDFSGQKIVWGNLNLTATYCIAESGIFVNAPCPMIVPANKYLLAVLNSKLADYYIRSLGVTRNGGYFEYKPMFIEKLPVPIIPPEQQLKFEELVSVIIEHKKCKKSNCIEEREIDNLVFQIYDLSEAEIEFIESQ